MSAPYSWTPGPHCPCRVCRDQGRGSWPRFDEPEPVSPSRARGVVSLAAAIVLLLLVIVGIVAAFLLGGSAT